MRSVAQQYKKYSILLLLITACISGCIFSSSKSEKKEVTPRVISLSIPNGEIITTRDVTIQWEGSEPDLEYQYILDGNAFEWIDTTFVMLRDLEEDEHAFSVRARNNSVTGDSLTVHFSVDAIKGPGLVFSPRKIGSISTVSLMLEDVSELMAAHIEIICPDQSAWLSGFSLYGELRGISEIMLFTDETNSRRLIIDIGFPGETGGLNGRVSLGTFVVRPLGITGEIRIDQEKTMFRDINNNPVEVNGIDTVRIER